ncbi:MAG: putative rane-bound ClpP-class protease [Chloroflexi bacterium]|jgi:membrane-bound serine protease (ClpP class)|nr:putative rane-bound ClpP-class protease [Chloroflexota bacterium]
MEGFIQFLSDPNVAYLLLALGVLGLLGELFHPGAIVPGAAGAIALILGMVGLGHLPFSWGGLALLALAGGLFAFELSSGLSGLLAVAALVAFVAGSLTLFQAPASGLNAVVVNPWLVGVMTLLMAGFFLYILKVVRSSRRAPVQSGLEALINHPAQAITRLNPKGKVRIQGEVWTAELEALPGLSSFPVEAGQEVEVTGLEGVVLKVRGRPGQPGEDSEWPEVGWTRP